ncbi:ribose 5-phosphate isomerase A [Gongronella butleri]|nr:ribose 5-phosphate isomerase A [Gongronella butleri]
MLRRLYSTLPSNAKQAAAWKAIDHLLETKHAVVGIGSGSTVAYAIQRLAQQRPHVPMPIVFVPTSFQARLLLQQHRLPIAAIDEHAAIDVTVDGADEVDPALNCIKGGGGCLFQERLVAQASQRWIIIADDGKKSQALGSKYTRGIPVEVVPMALTNVKHRLEQLFPGKSIQLRWSQPSDKAGPVVTDNGNVLLDCHLGEIPPEHVPDVYTQIKSITGVLDVGLFFGMADRAYFGQDDGQVDTMDASPRA